MAGRPIHIAEHEYDEGSKRLRFDQDAFRLIGSPERLSAARVAVISVAGAFRKGKSFLLNFFLRYLRALSRGDTRDWIRSDDRPDDGFHWRAGCDRDTTGILIWSEPFFIRKPDGEEVAVLLMDTEGTFDPMANQQDCTTIFAFSTLVSSVQIFNISQNIQETDLQHLRLFVEFAAMAKNSKEKALQHLCFLIRDWQNPDEFEFGADGGMGYLNKILEGDSQMPRENQELRQGIKQHFERASCCLLPHPGRAVTRRQFQGEVDILDSEFVGHVEGLVLRILSPENLVSKRINGKELTGEELFSFVEIYMQTFCMGGLPMTKTIFAATVELINLMAANDAAELLNKSMKPLAEQSAGVAFQEFDGRLSAIRDEAMKLFDTRCMEKESSHTIETREKLVDRLQGLCQHQRVLQQLKSEVAALDAKSSMMSDEIQRMQNQRLESAREMAHREEEFHEKVVEILAQSTSKEQMETLIQEEISKHSVALKEQEAQNADLEARIKEMHEMYVKMCKALNEGGEAVAGKQLEEMKKWRMEVEKFEKSRRAAENREFILRAMKASASVALSVANIVLRAASCCIS